MAILCMYMYISHKVCFASVLLIFIYYCAVQRHQLGVAYL